MRKRRVPRNILQEALDGLRDDQELFCTYRTFRAIKARFTGRALFKIKPGANIQIITKR